MIIESFSKPLYNILSTVFMKEKLRNKDKSAKTMEEESHTKTKLRRQIDLQQTEEDLRKVRGQIAVLEIELRKFHQDLTRAEMSVKDAENRMKSCKNMEFELNQRMATQKKAYLASATDPR